MTTISELYGMYITTAATTWAKRHYPFDAVDTTVRIKISLPFCRGSERESFDNGQARVDGYQGRAALVGVGSFPLIWYICHRIPRALFGPPPNFFAQAVFRLWSLRVYIENVEIKCGFSFACESDYTILTVYRWKFSRKLYGFDEQFIRCLILNYGVWAEKKVSRENFLWSIYPARVF